MTDRGLSRENLTPLNLGPLNGTFTRNASSFLLRNKDVVLCYLLCLSHFLQFGGVSGRGCLVLYEIVGAVSSIKMR